MRIIGFKDENYFLSNFYNHNVTFNNMTFKNNVSAYIAQMFSGDVQKKLFVNLLPMQAIRVYERSKDSNDIRKDWEDVREEVMYNICKEKFADKKLRQQLIDTKDEELINESTWENQFWGTNDGKGENRLGILLMKLRKELTAEYNKEEKAKQDEIKTEQIIKEETEKIVTTNKEEDVEETDELEDDKTNSNKNRRNGKKNKKSC